MHFGGVEGGRRAAKEVAKEYILGLSFSFFRFVKRENSVA